MHAGYKKQCKNMNPYCVSRMVKGHGLKNSGATYSGVLHDKDSCGHSCLFFASFPVQSLQFSTVL